MLLAEIHGKLSGTFGCTVCRTDESVDSGARVATEDALTSTVFGALRWLRPDLGLAPLLRRMELPFASSAVPVVSVWPRDGIPVIDVGEAELAEVGCEPDVVIDVLENSFALVEVKLGAVLGAEPMQLPKEAIFAHRHARGRPWRLLCLTRGTTAPLISGFRAEAGRLARGDWMPLADAVASYFVAAAVLGHTTGYPSASEVKASVRWLSWSALGASLEVARAQLSALPHEVSLLDDVIALLHLRGLMRPVFHGFEIACTRPLGWSAGALWRRSRTRRPLWSIEHSVTAWPALRWLSGSVGTRSGFQGFGAIPAKRPAPWPNLQWFSTGAPNRRQQR